MPEDTPIASMQREADAGLDLHGRAPHPGRAHRHARREVTEVVSKITWTGGTINPGEFQEFDISAGRCPRTWTRSSFPSIQTYASGEVVRWIDEPRRGR